MDIAAFDAWRANYDLMSYEDQQAFYDRMEADHGCQAGYNLAAYTQFINYVSQQIELPYVLELGGWKGELACQMLKQFPDIAIWVNVEICRAAVEKTVFISSEYATWIPKDFVWRVELPPANVVIASHFIEHIRAKHLDCLFENLPATTRYLGLQAPIPEDATAHDWTGYHGSHILEIGWKQVGALLGALGFGEIGRLRDTSGHGEFRAYVRY